MAAGRQPTMNHAAGGQCSYSSFSFCILSSLILSVYCSGAIVVGGSNGEPPPVISEREKVTVAFALPAHPSNLNKGDHTYLDLKW